MLSPLRILAAVSLTACGLVFMQCGPGMYSRSETEEQPPSEELVSSTIRGTWIWQKPVGSIVKFDVYYTFFPDERCEVRSSHDTTVVTTAYSVKGERSLWSNRQVTVLRVEGYLTGEVVSITPEKFVLRMGGADLIYHESYARVAGAP